MIRRKKTSLQIYLPLILLQGFERVVQGLRVRGSWRSNILQYFDPTVMTVTLCLSRFLVLLNRRPRVLTHQGPKAPSVGCGFPYHISSITSSDLQLNCLPGRRTQLEPELNSTGSSNSLNYIIVRRPLDLWNRMFNRHQAEITVMQFRGPSLPVHHSVVYHGNFSCSSHFISQFPPTRFPLRTATRMCRLLPVHHLEWHFWPGQKVKT